MEHFSDRLARAISERRSVVCVGLDPDLDKLPRRAACASTTGRRPAGDEAVAACFSEFCCGIIDAVAAVAAVVKPQAAFFEQYGAAGWRALARASSTARTSTSCW